MSRRFTLPAVALLLFAATALVTARPLGWGSATGAGGTRYKVSPIGVSHVLEPWTPVSPTRDCRWSPPGGEAALCAEAAGGTDAYRALRAVPILVLASGALCALAALLLLSGGGRSRRAAPTLIAGAAMAALAAPVIFAAAAPRALAALAGLDFGVGGSRGTLQLALAATVLASLFAVVVAPTAAAPARVGGRVAHRVSAALLMTLSAIGFLQMFPLPGALAFVAAGVVAGGGAGLLARRGIGAVRRA